MKILVFEYISGGGCNREELPDSLAREGLLMLKALLEGLGEIPDLEITVMLDARLSGDRVPPNVRTVLIGRQDDCFIRFEQLAERQDAVWPIAPEFEGILFSLSGTVERLGRTLLGSGSEAVRLAGDKYETYRCLRYRQIPTVHTCRLEEVSVFQGESIVKPVDGAGGGSCLIRDAGTFARTVERLRGTGSYIIQPHLYGEKTSLSCLFKSGRAWLLSVNRQEFDMVDDQYRLAAIQVNYREDPGPYRELVGRLAKAMPGLWGYAGIDLIETAEQVRVLEVNPRLTSSFAGLNEALGVNVAALVLQLLQGDPVIRRRADKTVTVQINQKTDDE
ncbi:ATP-grasp domain-containing protein [Methylomicrobium album]|uniref:Putative ATP-utilizing enzyme (ATP-grasp superfamily) n=1 Tax=Methylomicrobium album BG8 TaxID=686340 RepID=H8GG87_METAL|nr:ATP-grasp domain-containing protein [Methylomicrobium album]EIC31167.1 putative ATP-utilizing enzyme (ATP-grasp superfamily) [Methylomicrobium album BG8]